MAVSNREAGRRTACGVVPGPAGGTRLRWWDGSDWTENYRVRPTQFEVGGRMTGETSTAPGQKARAALPEAVETAGSLRRDTEAIISEVRKVAAQRGRARRRPLLGPRSGRGS